MKALILATVGVLGALWAITVRDYRLPGDVFFYAFATVNAAFVLIYGFGSPWHRTNVGRAIMCLMSASLAISVNGTLALWLGEYPGRTDVRNVLLLAAVLLIVNMVWLVLGVQRETRAAARRARAAAQWEDARPDATGL